MYTLSQTMPLSHPKPMRFPDQYRNAYLQDQDRRHSHHKIPVLGFVVEQIHARPCPGAAAQQGCAKQCGFRHAPLVPLGSAFVIRLHQQRRRVDNNLVPRQHCNGHGLSSLFLMVQALSGSYRCARSQVCMASS